MATLDELQAQLAALTQQVNEITTPPDDYYTHRFSGEEIDNAVDRVKDTPGSGAITAGDIGAAPSGFGLGAASKFIADSEDLNNIILNGWYYFDVPPANAPTSKVDGWPAGYSYMLVVTRSQNDVSQIIFANNQLQVAGCVLKRIRSSSGWMPWEWVNPPMLLGVEYRTTERHNGKPVYTKLVDCGAMPNNTIKEIDYSDDVNCRPISAIGTWNNDQISMPGENGTSGFPNQVQNISANGKKILLATHTDRSSYTAKATVKYWKTTD